MVRLLYQMIPLVFFLLFGEFTFFSEHGRLVATITNIEAIGDMLLGFEVGHKGNCRTKGWRSPPGETASVLPFHHPSDVTKTYKNHLLLNTKQHTAL